MSLGGHIVQSDVLDQQHQDYPHHPESPGPAIVHDLPSFLDRFVPGDAVAGIRQAVQVHRPGDDYQRDDEQDIDYRRPAG